jgi:hypothetical protein
VVVGPTTTVLPCTICHVKLSVPGGAPVCHVNVGVALPGVGGPEVMFGGFGSPPVAGPTVTATAPLQGPRLPASSTWRTRNRYGPSATALSTVADGPSTFPVTWGRPTAPPSGASSQVKDPAGSPAFQAKAGRALPATPVARTAVGTGGAARSRVKETTAGDEVSPLRAWVAPRT